MFDASSIYTDISSASAQVYYWSGRDAKSPRLSITFNTCVFRGGKFDSLSFDVDIIETIKNDYAVIASPIISPVIQHWTTLVRLYTNHRQPHEGKERCAAAQRHLKKVLPPVTLEKLKQSTLPRQYALREHIKLAGSYVAENVCLDNRDFHSELCRLGYAYLFMKEEAEYAKANNAKLRCELIKREILSLVDLYREDWQRTVFDSGNKVIEFFEECRDWCEKYEAAIEPWMARPKCILLEIPECEDAKRDYYDELEYSYLAWRLKVSYKTVSDAFKDTRLADHVKQVNAFFRHSPPSNLNVPEPPFTYPDLSYLCDSFDIPAHGLFHPIGNHIGVIYYDILGTPYTASKRVTLVVATPRQK